ncbi:hypothetical protein mEp554_77 [Escherichia phage mEp554]
MNIWKLSKQYYSCSSLRLLLLGLLSMSDVDFLIIAISSLLVVIVFFA